MTQPRAASSELVGPYRVVRAIGAGGSARIDLAVIERAYGFQRQIVLKRPLEHLRADTHVAETLRREAHLGGRLRHPNLVAVLDAGTHDGYTYLALEYVAGSSVRMLMHGASSPGATVRSLPLPAALSIVVGAARGLHEAHELAGDEGTPLGLVHRDVSPANILVDRDGTVKLSDFGIAKDTRVSTLSGSMRGTVTYMAPEQCRGHAFDRRADIFSLGVILHELISGRRLFWAENDVASLHKVLSAPLPDPRDAIPALAPELCAIAMRALARDPSERIASASELADRIEAFAARSGIVLGARAVAPLIANDEAPAAVSMQVTSPLPVPERDEPSLVTVIEGASGPDEPEEIEPTFGPNAAGDDEIATPVRRPTLSEGMSPAPVTPPPSRRMVLAIVAACAFGGIAIGAWIATRGPDTGSSAGTSSPSTSSPSTSPGPVAPAPLAGQAVEVEGASVVHDAAIVAPDATDDVATDDVATDDVATDDVAIEMEADSEPKPGTSPKADRPRKRPRDKRATPSTDAGVSPAKQDAGATPARQDAGAPPKVEWNPKMVFPGDRPDASAR